MYGPIKAIAIDDDPSHLLAITTSLSSLGIPSIGYWYDQTNVIPAPPLTGLEHVRLVFSDLNLMPGGLQDPVTIWTILVDCLKKVISKKNGPYLLVFWTSVGEVASEVERLLTERQDSLDGTPLPIEILKLRKGDFLVPLPEGFNLRDNLSLYYNDLHSRLPQLQSAVSRVIESNKVLNAISSWETRAATAAADSVNEIHRCAELDAKISLNLSESISKVIAKIAVAAAGKEAAMADPARALDAGMIDILIDQFGATVDSPDHKTIIANAIQQIVVGGINFSDALAMHAALNTFSHIDKLVSSDSTLSRGVVIPIKHPINGNTLGLKPNELLTSEFLYPPDLFDEVERPSILAKLGSIRTANRFVLVEIGASCDHAQNHARTRKYLIGLEIPSGMIDLARKSGKLRNGALELLGPWQVSGETIYLLVSFRRYWAWQKPEPPEGAPKYRLRSSVVDMLLQKNAVWNSRPGIVEFRPD